MTIRLRLALIVAATTAALVAVGAVAFQASLSSSMRRALEDSLRRSAARITADLSVRPGVVGTGSVSRDPAHDDTVEQVLLPSGAVELTTTHAGDARLLDLAELGRARHGVIYVERSRAAWHSPRLLLAEPLPGAARGVLVVGLSLDELENATARARDVLAVGGPLVVLAAALGAWLLASRALRPVERLRAEAAAISARPPDRRIAEPGTNDEIAKLARTLNSLLDRLQGALTHQREFVAVASHELRTPLAVLQAEIEVARRPGRTEDEMRRSLAVLEPRVAQLARLASDLLLLARGDEGALGLDVKTERLEPLVAESLSALYGVAASRGVSLALDADPTIAASVDAGRFQQIVDNLVANAVQHAAGTTLVQVFLRLEGHDAILEVRDRGPGFPDDLLARAFERFTRGESARRGAGLGLAVVRLLVEAHGGTVDACNVGEGGASVVVRLPGRAVDAVEHLLA